MTELSGDVRIAAGDENDILNFHSRDSFDGEQQHLSVEIDSNTPPATQDATDGDTELSVDVAVCRVCHCEGDDDHPLFHPCKCAGSIRFIHQDCLTSWLNFSKKANCELCGETFGFRNIYADNMPPKISWWELIIELYPSVIKVAGSIGAVLCHLLFVWVVVPYVTFLELLWCLFYLLEENLDPKWYICESPSDCIIMWFLGLSVTLFLCFLSLIVVHCFQLIYPTQIYPTLVMNDAIHTGIRTDSAIPIRPIALIEPVSVIGDDSDTLGEIELSPEEILEPAHRAQLSTEGDVETHGPFAESLADLSLVDLDDCLLTLQRSKKAEPLYADSNLLSDISQSWHSLESSTVLESISDSLGSFVSTPPRPLSPTLLQHIDVLLTADNSLQQDISLNPIPVAADDPFANEIAQTVNGELRDDEVDENYYGDAIIMPIETMVDEFINPDIAELPVTQSDNENISDIDDPEEEIIRMILEPRHFDVNRPQRHAQQQDILIEIDATRLFEFFTTLPDAMNIIQMQNPRNIYEWVGATVVVLCSHAILLVLFFVAPTLGGLFLHQNFGSSAFFQYIFPKEKADYNSLRNFISSTVLDAIKGQGKSVLYESVQMDIQLERVVNLAMKSIYLTKYWLIGSFISFMVGLSVILVCGTRMYLSGAIAFPEFPFTRNNFRKVSRILKQVKLLAKVLLEFSFHTMMIPHILGWLIDIVTLNTMGVTLSNRLKYCTAHPVTSSFLHSLIGFGFVVHITAIIRALKEILLDKFANSLYLDGRFTSFFSYAPDLEFEIAARRPLRDVFVRIFLTLSYLIPAVFFMVFLPVRFGHYVVFSFEPIMIHIEEIDHNIQIPLELLVFHVLMPYLVERLQYRLVVYDAVSMFMYRFCDILELSILKPRYLLDNDPQFDDIEIPPHRLNAGLFDEVELINQREQEERHGYEHVSYTSDETDVNVHDASMSMDDIASSVNEIFVAEEVEIVEADTMSHDTHNEDSRMAQAGVIIDASENYFWVKILGLICAISISFFLFSAIALYVPLSIGRETLKCLHLAVEHDMYNICTGYVAIWSVYKSVYYVINDVGTQRSFGMLMALFQKYAVVGVKVCFIGSIWTGAVPLLVGTLFQLIFVIPVNAAHNESAQLSLLYGWALGCLQTKLWIRCSTLGFFGDNYVWKRRFDLVLNEGLNGISFSFIMTELMIPIMVLLLDYLLIPYFSSLLLLRICVWADTTLDYAVQTLIARYSYAIHLLLRICCYMLACAISYAQKRLDAIRDARYLLARELTNRPSSIVP